MKYKNKNTILMIIFAIIMIILLSINIVSTLDKNLIYETKVEKKDNCLIYYPLFDNARDKTIKEYLNTLDTKNCDRIKYSINDVDGNTSILFKIYKDQKIVDYKSIIFNKLNALVDINSLFKNPDVLNDKINLYIYNNKIKLTSEEYNKSKKEYFLKDNEIDIYINKYNELNEVAFIKLNYNEIKNDFNLKVKLDDKYVMMQTTTTTTVPIPKKIIAFSFDDGPSKYTLEIASLLETYNYKATFFEVGYNIRNFPEVTKALHDKGFEIGNHTIDHSRLTKLSSDKILEKLNSNNDLYFNATNDNMLLVRPPYGAVNKLVKSTINSPIITWSVDSRDWESRDPAIIVPKAKEEIHEGDIVLFHDIYATTLESMKELIPYLYEQNFQIVSVSELFANKGIALENGHIYRCAK